MATYKVIQDVEAEDKFVGPLTLKQFIFAISGGFFGWLCVFALTKGFPWAIIIFAPLMLLGFFLAIPWTRDQPTEVWVLAKIRFRLKPKKRVWDQDGLQDLVTITVPKKVERHLTNNLSEKEVTSRLKTLAETIDSRGWNIKNATHVPSLDYQSDRLVDPGILPRQVPEIETNIVDVLDSRNPVSANFAQMMQSKTEKKRQQNLEKMDKIRQGTDIQEQQPQAIPHEAYIPLHPLSEKALSKPELKVLPADPTDPSLPSVVATDPRYSTKKRPERQFRNTDTIHSPKTGVTSPPTPAIMNLARNDDLDVATIARQANKTTDEDNEVVIPLR